MKYKFGVPCSKLRDRITDVEVPCTSEGEAMALAAGVWLGGKESEVYMQNSGLGDIIDIVTSLYKPYKIPLPKMLMSLRQKPEHHEFMGNITKSLMKLIEYDGEVEWVV